MVLLPSADDGPVPPYSVTSVRRKSAHRLSTLAGRLR
jgi:hypothetical protein